jgi:hypothetical protein
MDLTQIIIAFLTGGAALGVLQKAIDAYRGKRDNDTSLVLRDRNELQEFRQWLASEVESLSAISEKVKEEKHRLELKVVILERDLRDERRYSTEQAEEVIKLAATIEMMKSKEAHLFRMSELEVKED